MINLGFWGKLKRPVFVLAPMADVTDCAFRQIINKYGKPAVFWTEFVSADGLAHPIAREKLLIDLKYSENEHPIVAQIFGGRPENIKEAAKLCKELGFDGIDINMGCPEKNIVKQCACAALINDPELAKLIIRAAKEGGGGLPVSVKTRIGFNKNEIETWIPALLEEDLAVLTVHLRTKKEMSDVPAHWDVMQRIVEIRDEMKKGTLIFGNGDVLSIEDGKQKVKESGCDGVMLGRAIFGNPWLFSSHVPTLEEKLKVMIEHTKLFEKMLGEYKNFAIMKKHYKAYTKGFDARPNDASPTESFWRGSVGRGAKELRMKLMQAENAGQVEFITNNFLTKLDLIK